MEPVVAAASAAVQSMATFQSVPSAFPEDDHAEKDTANTKKEQESKRGNPIDDMERQQQEQERRRRKARKRAKRRKRWEASGTPSETFSDGMRISFGNQDVDVDDAVSLASSSSTKDLPSTLSPAALQRHELVLQRAARRRATARHAGNGLAASAVAATKSADLLHEANDAEAESPFAPLANANVVDSDTVLSLKADIQREVRRQLQLQPNHSKTTTNHVRSRSASIDSSATGGLSIVPGNVTELSAQLVQSGISVEVPVPMEKAAAASPVSTPSGVHRTWSAGSIMSFHAPAERDQDDTASLVASVEKRWRRKWSDREVVHQSVVDAGKREIKRLRRHLDRAVRELECERREHTLRMRQVEQDQADGLPVVMQRKFDAFVEERLPRLRAQVRAEVQQEAKERGKDDSILTLTAERDTAIAEAAMAAEAAATAMSRATAREDLANRKIEECNAVLDSMSAAHSHGKGPLAIEGLSDRKSDISPFNVQSASSPSDSRWLRSHNATLQQQVAAMRREATALRDSHASAVDRLARMETRHSEERARTLNAEQALADARAALDAERSAVATERRAWHEKQNTPREEPGRLDDSDGESEPSSYASSVASSQVSGKRKTKRKKKTTPTLTTRRRVTKANVSDVAVEVLLKRSRTECASLRADVARLKQAAARRGGAVSAPRPSGSEKAVAAATQREIKRLRTALDAANRRSADTQVLHDRIASLQTQLGEAHESTASVETKLRGLRASYDKMVKQHETPGAADEIAALTARVSQSARARDAVESECATLRQRVRELQDNIRSMKVKMAKESRTATEGQAADHARQRMEWLREMSKVRATGNAELARVRATRRAAEEDARVLAQQLRSAQQNVIALTRSSAVARGGNVEAKYDGKELEALTSRLRDAEQEAHRVGQELRVLRAGHAECGDVLHQFRSRLDEVVMDKSHIVYLMNDLEGLLCGVCAAKWAALLASGGQDGGTDEEEDGDERLAGEQDAGETKATPRASPQHALPWQ